MLVVSRFGDGLAGGLLSAPQKSSRQPLSIFLLRDRNCVNGVAPICSRNLLWLSWDLGISETFAARLLSYSFAERICSRSVLKRF